MKMAAPIVAVALASMIVPCASAAVLYAPATSPPALLNASPSNFFYLSDTAGVTVNPGTEGTVLDTLPAGNVAKAGFSAANATFPFTNPLMPVISQATGYDLLFRAGVTAEQHADRNGNSNLADDDRAGFSVLILSSDHLGIELGFFTDRIFSQNANFVGQGESAAFTTTAMTDYDLHIAGGQYTLSSGGNVLLSGALRDYTAGGAPYTIPNFLFVGDDTTSAAATAQVSHLEVVVPEPASMALLALAVPALVSRRRRRS